MAKFGEASRRSHRVRAGGSHWRRVKVQIRGLTRPIGRRAFRSALRTVWAADAKGTVLSAVLQIAGAISALRSRARQQDCT